MGKTVGAQQRGEARSPGGEFGAQRSGRAACGDAVSEGFQSGVDDVAEGARGKRAFGTGERGLAGSSGAVGIAVGQPVGAGFGETGGGIEGEREALQRGVGWECCCGQVEDKRFG